MGIFSKILAQLVFLDMWWIFVSGVRSMYNTLVFVNIMQFLIDFVQMLIFSEILPLALCISITTLTSVQHSH